MRNPHAGEPFDTSDEQIADALLDVSIPTLMLSLVHMSGDPELIRGRLKPAGLFLNEVQGYMTEEDKAEVRTIALDVIRDYRDRGCPEPEPISAELLHEMMAWLVCEDVPPEYVPMLMEEMELDGSDARRVTMPADQASRDAFPVVVIGCGQSGLLAGIRLKQAGIPFTIVEKNEGTGGTWWENTYPGARVDVGSHFYCYSFEPSDAWTEFFVVNPSCRPTSTRSCTSTTSLRTYVGEPRCSLRRGTTMRAPGRCGCDPVTGRSPRSWPARSSRRSAS